MAMDQYLYIPYLGGWTSIYQLFWCSPGVQGFDPSPYAKLYNLMQIDLSVLFISPDFTTLTASGSERLSPVPPNIRILRHENLANEVGRTCPLCRPFSCAHDWRQMTPNSCHLLPLGLWVLNFWPKMPFWTSNQHKWHSQNQFCNEMKAGNIWKTKHMMLVCWCSSTSHLAPVHSHIFFKMFKPHMNNFKKDLTCVSPACKKSTSVGWGWQGLRQSETLGTRRKRHRPLRS
jgi:hypothetical protein